jgi:putative pyruvate formate lyase activating enzyme
MDLSHCMLCPRRCGVDRTAGGAGVCGCGALPRIAHHGLHHWEEPCLSGARGSGTVFFSGCNLGCVYCQNHAISRRQCGEPFDAAALAGLYLKLQSQGAHNINLVTPTPHVLTIADSLERARGMGLSIPVVYNTSGYESPGALERLSGLIDIYLPDLKYFTPQSGLRYSAAPDYFIHASRAVLQMHDQVGVLAAGTDGIAVRGLLIRHLVLPCCLAETRGVLTFIAGNLPPDTHVSLMSQYMPAYRAAGYDELSRPLTQREYGRAVDFCLFLGLKNVYIQGLDASDPRFVPPFEV